MDDFLVRFEERRKARAEAEREFTIAGETLRFRPTIAPEVMFRFQEPFRHAANGNGDGGDLSDDLLLQIADETILACLEPGSYEGWARLRSVDAEQPLTYQDIFDIVGYLFSKVAGLPTGAPSDSSSGRTETVSKSKAVSSSPAKTRTKSA